MKLKPQLRHSTNVWVWHREHWVSTEELHSRMCLSREIKYFFVFQSNINFWYKFYRLIGMTWYQGYYINRMEHPYTITVVSLEVSSLFSVLHFCKNRYSKQPIRWLLTFHWPIRYHLHIITTWRHELFSNNKPISYFSTSINHLLTNQKSTPKYTHPAHALLQTWLKMCSPAIYNLLGFSEFWLFAYRFGFSFIVFDVVIDDDSTLIAFLFI